MYVCMYVGMYVCMFIHTPCKYLLNNDNNYGVTLPRVRVFSRELLDNADHI